MIIGRLPEHPRRILRLTVLLLVCWALLGGSRAEDRWLEVRSPHFTVVSNASRGKASRVAREFEQIREAIRRVLPGMSLDPGQPIVILAVRDQSDLRQLIPQYWEESERAHPAGLFLKGPERHWVALRLNVGGDRPFQTVYHEYLHVLVSLNLPQAPLWVNEGLAEFYANSSFSDGEVVFGLPSEPHVAYLRQHSLLPLSSFLDIDEKSPYYNQSHKVTIFYSQAWALVHLLLTHNWGSEESALDQYLRKLSDGVPSSEAARALGDLPRLEEQLREYVNQDNFFVFHYPETIDVATDGFQVRRLDTAEAAALRGSFLVSNERYPEGEALIEQAIALDPKLALAHESLGLLRYVTGDPKGAREAFSKALQLDSDSYLAHYFFGFLSLDGVGDAGSEAGVEASLRRSIELRPSFAYAYTALATLLLRRQEGEQEALRLAREACRLEANNPKLLQTLAYALGRAGRLEEAGQVLGQIYLWAASESDLELAGRVEQTLEGFRAYWESRTEYARQVDQMERERQKTEQARSSWRTRQVEGTVRSVSCTAPASLEIVLDTETEPGAVRLVSHDLSVVQFFFRGEGPGGDFHPCQGLTGRRILASYETDRQDAFNRLLSVKLQ